MAWPESDSAGCDGVRRAAARGALGPGAFARVRGYIEENVGERISLDDLARVAGMSRFHFARQFRIRTGESPMGFRLRLRIERSKAMLDAARVSDVAAALGFADQSHFTRTFRRLVGVPPSRFAASRPPRSLHANSA